MSSFLGKIKGIFSFKDAKKRKFFLASFLVFVFCGILFANFVLAWDWPTGENIAKGIASIITQMLLLIAQLFIKLTIWASQLFIVIASYSNFINSSAVKLGWVLVRDVVNMFFVLILLVIAFGTVLGLEQYEWKKLMVKLIFAAVLVNFSRLICGVIIDAAQVFMMTFVNGFAATAGGNVINGLNLNSIYSLSQDENIAKNAASATDIFLTGIAAVFFAVISFFVICAYLFIILARVVVLWTLIILSPIAFISSVLPATQKYASEWWKEFSNHVLAGPILAFFFWLSFAIVGDGNSFNEVLPTDQSKRYETEALFGGTATGISQAMEWGKMASFAIAIALLMVGVKKTQELGVTGANTLTAAASMGIKTAKVLTGVAAAGWGIRKGVGVAAWAGKGVAMKMPVIGGEAWKRGGRAIKAGAGAKYDQVMSRYEQITQKGLKGAEEAKGLGGWARRRLWGAALTPMQEEKLTEYKETVAKSEKEARAESLGMGGTEIGHQAGTALAKAKLAKEEADRAKKLGLGEAEALYLEKLGKYNAARDTRARTAAEVEETDSKKTAATDPEMLGVNASEIAKRQEAIKKRLSEAYDKNDEDGISKAAEELAEVGFEAQRLLAVAMSKGTFAYQTVRDTFLDQAGYNREETTVADSSKMHMTVATGIDTSEGYVDEKGELQIKDKAKRNKELELARRVREAQQSKSSCNPINNNLAAQGYKMAMNYGITEGAAAYGSGIVVKEVTNEKGEKIEVRSKAVDIGGTTGDEDMKGNKWSGKKSKKELGELKEKMNKGDKIAKAEYDKYQQEKFNNSLTPNSTRIKHLEDEIKINVAESLNVKDILKYSKQNGVQQVRIDDSQLNTLGRGVAQVPWQNIQKFLTPKLCEGLNQDAASGVINGAVARTLLMKLQKDMKGNATMVSSLEGVLSELTKLAAAEPPNPKDKEYGAQYIPQPKTVKEAKKDEVIDYEI